MPRVERLYHIILIAFCGTWLLLKALVGPTLIILLILSFIGNQRNENRFRINNLNWLWILLFGIYALSLLWSSSPDYEALERKLAFIAFPLLFAFKWGKPLPISKMWLAHAIGCLLLVAIAYYDAIACQLTLGDSVRCFSTTYFSQVHHPSYFSAFLLLSIIGLLFKKIAWFDEQRSWISWLLICVFSAMHLHLGTLAGMLALIMIFVVYLSIELAKKWGVYRSILFGLVVFCVGIFTALQSSEIKADALNAIDFTSDYLKSPQAFVESRKEPLQGNELRLILWTASFQEAYAYPFGLGLGGMEPSLSVRLIHWGYPLQAKKQFNPHNQFLQILNEIGILGLILFLAIIVQFIRCARKQNEIYLIIFAIVFAIFSLFESVLQRESGIVFFVCWFCVFNTFWINKTLIKSSR